MWVKINGKICVEWMEALVSTFFCEPVGKMRVKIREGCRKSEELRRYERVDRKMYSRIAVKY